MKYYFLSLLLVVAGVWIIAGPRGEFFQKPPLEVFPDMDRQAKVKAQVPSEFFADDRGGRPPVAGTVPLGYEMPSTPDQGLDPKAEDISSPFGSFSAGTDYANTGKIEGFWGDGIPFEVTPAVMERGHQRYQISCKVCHGGTGAGNGITSKYGFSFVASLTDARIREMPDGEIFNTITHGKNTMMSYGDKLTVKDRWAIIAYVRALQTSQAVSVNELPEDLKTLLNKP